MRKSSSTDPLSLGRFTMAASAYTMRVLPLRERSIFRRHFVSARADWRRAIPAFAGAATLTAFAYAAAVMLAVPVPRLVVASSATRVVIDLVLLGLVALHHRYAGAAPGGIARAWVADPVLRYTADLTAVAMLVSLLVGGWQLLPAVAWEVVAPAPRALLWAGCLLGWGLAAAAAVRDPQLGCATPAFHELHAALRLPARRWSGALVLGVAVAGFSTPRMSIDHLLVATAIAAWLAVHWIVQPRLVRRFW
jgi:hypothetical protein